MTGTPLAGRRILLVEDEYIVAFDLADALTELGAAIVGPTGSVAGALGLIARDPSIDSAVLDINLNGERVYPVAEALAARGVPFVFTSGYDIHVIPARFAGEPRCEKPVDRRLLLRLLLARRRDAG